MKKIFLSLVCLFAVISIACSQDAAVKVKLSLSYDSSSNPVINASITNKSKTLSIKTVEIKVSYGDPAIDPDNLWQTTKKSTVEIEPDSTGEISITFSPALNDVEAYSAYVDRVIFSDGTVRKGYGNIYFKE